jgi:ketosteroid isomerase-like protein
MKSLIEKFYQAFSELDSETMIACYHDDIQFEDPAFGILKSDKAKNLWRMLCQNQKNAQFRIEFSDIRCDEIKGQAHWEAHYIFPATGRKIHNRIDATFEFKDGKIIHHIDRFNLYTWARQTLGLSGYLLGWTSMFKSRLNLQTAKMLSRFEEKQNGPFVE